MRIFWGKRTFVTLMVVFVMLMSSTVFGEHRWTGTTEDWFDANNWSEKAVPGSSNYVTIGGGTFVADPHVRLSVERRVLSGYVHSAFRYGSWAPGGSP